jgi:hypothetical protein
MDIIQPEPLSEPLSDKPQIYDYSNIDYITKSLSTKTITLDNVDLLQTIQELKQQQTKLEERIIALEWK